VLSGFGTRRLFTVKGVSRQELFTRFGMLGVRTEDLSAKYSVSSLCSLLFVIVVGREVGVLLLC